MKSLPYIRLTPWLALSLAGALQAAGAAQAASPAPAHAASTVSQPTPAVSPAAGPTATGKSQGPGKDKSGKNGKPAAEPDTIILSDTLHYNDKEKTSVFTGNVVMTRGQMTLRADKLVAHQDPEGNQYGTATMDTAGKLVYVREENPEKFEVLEARGLRAQYNGKTNEIEMIGQAVVTRFICGTAFDKISGERVRYNQKTDIYEAFSGPQSPTRDRRVRSIAQPQAKIDAAIAECQKKSGQTPAPKKTHGSEKPHHKTSHNGKAAKS